MNLTLKLVTPLLLITLILSSCEKTVNDGRIRVEEDLLKWIKPFSTDGEITEFSTNDGLEARTEVLITSVDNGPSFADCQVDGITRQCQYTSAATEFTSAEGEKYNLLISVNGKGSLWIMPARQGVISTPVLVWSKNDGIFDEGYPDFFTSAKTDEYMFNGSPTEAFIINQVGRNMIFGQVLAPKRAVLVKGVGFVEWEDFSGNIYILE